MPKRRAAPGSRASIRKSAGAHSSEARRLSDRQIELLRPREIRAALSANSVIWLPLGAIEWHGEHLPVGSDALIAQGLCLAAAQIVGGLVLPPLHFGIGGKHGDYPWSVLMGGGQEIEALLAQTARRLSAMEVDRFVVLSGHFASEQLDTIDRFAESWNATGTRPRIVATSIDRCPDMQLTPDHAGAFETALLSAIEPDAVAIGELPSVAAAPDHKNREDPESPLWGITGTDPRTVDLGQGEELRNRLVEWLVRLSR